MGSIIGYIIDSNGVGVEEASGTKPAKIGPSTPSPPGNRGKQRTETTTLALKQ